MNDILSQQSATATASLTTPHAATTAPQSAAPPAPLRLFQAYGLEIEYMIVDRSTREIRSIAHDVLHELELENARTQSVTAPGTNLTSPEAPFPVEWSNELVSHVIEAKCTMPIPHVETMLDPLSAGVTRVNEILAKYNACLMPSGAHPWMNPGENIVLWPHENHEIYAQYDQIFGCNTHGWTNLQSVHLNLPFGDAEEFQRLHAAIRLVLPLIPALAASSPYLEGSFTGLMDARLKYYRTNSNRVPSMTGPLVPEPVFTPEAYEANILQPLYAELAPFDPQGLLRHEWANARGAIARFDRNTIEIRVMDSQECPLADLALAHAVAGVTRLLVNEVPLAVQKAWSTARLNTLFNKAVALAEDAPVDNPEYAALFGVSSPRATFGQLWHTLLARPELSHPVFDRWYKHYFTKGSLATRLVKRGGLTPSRDRLEELADDLCAGLRQGRLFA